MNSKIYMCKRFEMYNMSISELFGKSPKIHYICGKCNSYNETRLSMKSIEMNRPYARCKLCGIVNKIPIEVVRGL